MKYTAGMIIDALQRMGGKNELHLVAANELRRQHLLIIKQKSLIDGLQEDIRRLRNTNGVKERWSVKAA